MYKPEQLKWIIYFRKKAQGEIPNRIQSFYCIDDYVTEDEINAEMLKGDDSETKIQLVTPAHQPIKESKMEAGPDFDKLSQTEGKGHLKETIQKTHLTVAPKKRKAIRF